MSKPEFIPSHYQLARSIEDCNQARWIKIVDGSELRAQGDFHLLQKVPYWRRAGKKHAYHLFTKHLQKRIDKQQVWIDLIK